MLLLLYLDYCNLTQLQTVLSENVLHPLQKLIMNQPSFYYSTVTISIFMFDIVF